MGEVEGGEGGGGMGRGGEKGRVKEKWGRGGIREGWGRGGKVREGWRETVKRENGGRCEWWRCGSRPALSRDTMRTPGP